MQYLLPLTGPHADGPCLAGGWVRFDRVIILRRNRPSKIVPVHDLSDADLAPLVETRGPVVGIPMTRPSVMGVLNVTPDSFSDGGRYFDPAAVRTKAESMEAADIIDIGGESTRPGASEVPADEEIARIRPALATLTHRAISVDTRKAAVARVSVEAGAAMINDVSGLTFDPDMAATIAASDAALCLMHSVATPETMQDDPRYDDVVFDIFDALASRIAAAEAAGIPRARIVVDPGIGFGKTEAHNLALIRRIALFHGLGVPLLLGVSRKGFIGRIGHAPRADQRMPGTLAITLAAVAQGVQMHRVHDVAEIAQGLALWRQIGDLDGPVWN
ncbi:Dihydropteroate synthase [Jannaschia seosinensis]|uniref:Dihydropteroate synthase n=1 Tax=Jannaschia seosinensis TaxID=313367 RepID=A0A0M7BGW1_9RHOB|nr:dihydropteroate synthase [Jannaschia seosinensis]CUH41084.1 Dihydropteroate synthase [Jannaschia seosinensis]